MQRPPVTCETRPAAKAGGAVLMSELPDNLPERNASEYDLSP